jgi:hypothetical protein
LFRIVNDGLGGYYSSIDILDFFLLLKSMKFNKNNTEIGMKNKSSSVSFITSRDIKNGSVFINNKKLIF